jgi:RNA-directed DNA polymerase
MKQGLLKPSHELRDGFLKLHNRDGVAQLLEMTTGQLNFHLYVLPSEKKYKSFSIPKRSGGTREISAPVSAIKVIQRNLKQVLEAVYTPKPATHGFVTGRSIVSNARLHKRRRYVLNIDLENYFPAIHFGRVRGMFMKNPYNLNDEVSTILAQICCHNKVLPQGAPTSPIVSNMICARLDAKLQQLAKEHQCTYSRYADDITFSTNRSKFPLALAHLSEIGQGEIGNELCSVIEENGFQINPKKTRLQSKQQRQEVTGLTVNRYPNVQRRYVKQVRGIMHAWGKYGLDTTTQRYYEKYLGGKYLNPQNYRPPLGKVVMGKIEFIGMVKGKNSPVYRDLLRKFTHLTLGYVKNTDIGDISSAGVLIYTEEKTDGKHLIAALRSFQSQKMFRQISLSCLDNQGFDSLEKCLDFTVSNSQVNTKPQIFIFDRDINKKLYLKVGGDEQYRFWGNGVYSMVLPVPKHREQSPEISMVFYYKDEDIVGKDKSGSRLFLGSEFNKSTGRHLSEDLNCMLLDKLGNPLKVVDDKVFNEHNENVALSKDKFAENILDQTDQFKDVDFSGFTPLFDVVSTIISDFNGEIGSVMLPPTRPLKVFLCHSSTDKPAVFDLYERLTADGVDAWLDKEKLLPGQEWELEIRKAVREADLVIVCLSKEFNQAGFRQKEVKLALETALEKPDGEIYIIPARLEECETLESLRRLHWVNLFEDDGYKKLTQALSLRAEKVEAVFNRINSKPNVGKLAEYNLVGQMGILTNLGLTQSKQGDFLHAKDYFEQALRLSQELGDRNAEATILTSLASTHENLGDLVRATELYQQALLLSKKMGL